LVWEGVLGLGDDEGWCLVSVGCGEGWKGGCGCGFSGGLRSCMNTNEGS
jgi:hypothetical protein